MKDRIKLVRTEANLSQKKFGEIIGVGQSTIAGYEKGIRTPIDAVIFLICRTFNINEEWLKTGKGDMRTQTSREYEIAQLTADLFKTETDSFKSHFTLGLSKLSLEEWKALESILSKLAYTKKINKPS